MVRIALLLSALLGTAVAAPAIVWQRDTSASAPEHHSDSVSAADLMQSALSGHSGSPDSSSVVFFLGRDADGREMLGHLASSGALPRTQAKYGSAASIHHHVDGLESAATVQRDAMAAAASSGAATVGLGEFLSRMGESPENETAKDQSSRRAREVQAASVLVVDVPAAASPADVDRAIAMAVDSPRLSSVVLAAQRSTDEVKRARAALANDRKEQKQQQRVQQQEAPRRRLEDNQQNQDDDNNNRNDQDGSDGVAYVHMTPNILAGILYTLLFVVVTQIGIGCMGSIQGQGDIYVKKMPTIGREA